MSFQKRIPAKLQPHIVWIVVLLVAILVGAALVSGIFFAVRYSRTASQAANPPASQVDTASQELVNPHTGSAETPTDTISLGAAKALLDAGTAAFVDLRSGEEYTLLHIKDAYSITFMELEDELSALPEGTTIIVYGATSAASSTGAQIFKSSGYPNVVALEGGMEEWMNAGYPVAKGIFQ
jgi:rhodanese-related sulfurtransferase